MLQGEGELPGQVRQPITTSAEPACLPCQATLCNIFLPHPSALSNITLPMLTSAWQVPGSEEGGGWSELSASSTAAAPLKSTAEPVSGATRDATMDRIAHSPSNRQPLLDMGGGHGSKAGEYDRGTNTDQSTFFPEGLGKAFGEGGGEDGKSRTMDFIVAKAWKVILICASRGRGCESCACECACCVVDVFLCLDVNVGFAGGDAYFDRLAVFLYEDRQGSQADTKGNMLHWAGKYRCNAGGKRVCSARL